MLLLIRWHGRVMAVPLSQLAAIDPDDATAEAIVDCHYWVRGAIFLNFQSGSPQLRTLTGNSRKPSSDNSARTVVLPDPGPPEMTKKFGL
jgi:hypothetical protein